MQKVVAMFSDLALSMQQQVKQWQPHLPAVLVESEPRISRGEQYQRLPWVMLDYPRIFGKEDIFAIRTFFLVGKLFQYYPSPAWDICGNLDGSIGKGG